MTHATNIHTDKHSDHAVAVVEILAKEFDNFATVQIEVQQGQDPGLPHIWHQCWFFATRPAAEVFMNSLATRLAAVEWQDHTRTYTADPEPPAQSCWPFKTQAEL